MTKFIGLFHSLICNPVKQGYTACIAFLYNLRFNLKPHFDNINDWKTCQADALGILNALNRTGYVMTGAGCCMPFVLLIGLTTEMLPDT